MIPSLFIRFLGELLWKHWKTIAILGMCWGIILLHYEILLMKMISHSLTLLQVSIFFDILFIIQHYVLYPERKRKSETIPEYDNATKASAPPSSQNV